MKITTLYKTAVLFCFASSYAGMSYAQTYKTFDEPSEEGKGNWEVTVGVGVLHEAISPGVDQYESQVLPYLDIAYKDRLFLNVRHGLGAYLIKQDDKKTGIFEDLAVGVALDYDEGRDASDFDKRPALKGLNKIDSTIEGKIFAEAEISSVELDFEIAQDLSGDGHDGWHAELSANLDFPVSDRFMLMVGPSIRYASEEYQQAYYGLDSSEAIATGFSEYKAGAGLESASFGIQGRYALSKNWSVLGLAQYESLLGDAKDSPFVEKDNQVVTGLAVAYTF
ncbi:MipA/OmpV family protein [Hirschia maritima]|uniref:MipA/OmpV family protein n=1 Tax=Hirschia maritima TaxID=1121961 RepID=UPI00037BA489|nr:MipA/OmpV family protein [Hirschia maritima]